MKKPLKLFIKSPLNYIGGKQKILPQIIPLFPQDINCFVDLFTGGANVGLNVNAKKIILNDNLVYLIDFYRKLQSMNEQDVLDHIHKRINEYELSLTNEEGYKKLRSLYNKIKDPLDLFVLVAYSFNHQIRFNNSQEFNNPFGKDRSCFNSSMEFNLIGFINKLHTDNIELNSCDFTKLDLSELRTNDFVYCDPPYLITTGTYNDGKRGFDGWGEKKELQLLDMLDLLDNCSIKFALSNVLKHKGKTNTILENWLNKNPKYIINNITMNYSNSSYQIKIRDITSTKEVLITNYIPIIKPLYNQTPELPFVERTENAIYRQ